MTIEETQQEIIDEFSMFDDWQDRYEYLIELGKSLPEMDPDEMTDDLLIKGCQSKVWLKSEYRDGKVYYEANSDAIIPKGIAALLVRVYSGHTPEEIIQSNTDFIEKIELQEFLSPTRANGLLAMIKQIKFDALGYKMKAKANN